MKPDALSSNRRRIGSAVILHAFLHSYFGVSAFTNAFSEHHLPGMVRLFAASSGLSWGVLIAGGAVLAAGRRSGIPWARTAAIFTACLELAGLALFPVRIEQSPHLFLFTLSRPASAFLLFYLLKPGDVKTGQRKVPLRSTAFIIGIAALMPWITFGVIKLASGSVPLSQPIGLPITSFMSLWSVLPCVVLVLLAPMRFREEALPGLVKAGGAGGIAAALYTFTLIWLQRGNTFLLALMPPVIFFGQALGIAAVQLQQRIARRDRKSSTAP